MGDTASFKKNEYFFNKYSCSIKGTCEDSSKSYLLMAVILGEEVATSELANMQC